MTAGDWSRERWASSFGLSEIKHAEEGCLLLVLRLLLLLLLLLLRQLLLLLPACGSLPGHSLN